LSLLFPLQLFAIHMRRSLCFSHVVRSNFLTLD
jgi:hypothetical protein